MFAQMKGIISYLKGRVRSFGYAFKGIGLLFSTQANARIHLVALVAIAALGWWIGLVAWEWCMIVLCMGLVLAAEAINSSIEFLTDLASPDIHPLAEKTKDLAAGAVLITAIFAGIVWAIIHIPKLIALWETTPTP